MKTYDVFSISDLILPVGLGSGRLCLLTEMITGNISWGSRADWAWRYNITAICEPIVKTMQEPRRLSPNGLHSLLQGQLYFLLYFNTILVLGTFHNCIYKLCPQNSVTDSMSWPSFSELYGQWIHLRWQKCYSFITHAWFVDKFYEYTEGGAKVDVQYCFITSFHWSLAKWPTMIIWKKKS
jgi:hypothetical protein